MSDKKKKSPKKPIEQKAKDWLAIIFIIAGVIVWPWIVGVRTLLDAKFTFTEFNINPIIGWLDVLLFGLLGYLIYKQMKGRHYVLVDRAPREKVKIVEAFEPVQNVNYEDPEKRVYGTEFRVDIKEKLKEFHTNQFKWSFDRFNSEYEKYKSVEKLRLDLKNKMRPWVRNPEIPKNISMEQWDEMQRKRVTSQATG